ncbi:MAG: alkaline phosphatase family protein, partial [Myxococcota bacterium]
LALVWFVNPWFMDHLQSWLFITSVPLMMFGWWLGPHLPGKTQPVVWASTVFLIYVVSLLRPLPSAVDTRLVVLGIDGATWTVVERAETPNLDALKAEGFWGDLMAAEPMFSPLLWTTMATGKTPDEHGIRGLNTRADQATAARFWEVARSHDLTVGLYKWLVTWPPPSDDVPGFTVPAWLASDAKTHPMGLSWVKEMELSNREHRKRVATDRSMGMLVVAGIPDGLRWSTIWAGIRFSMMEKLSPMPPRKRTAFLRRMRLRIDRDVFISQLHEHEPDVATFTVYLTDALSHTHWSSDGGRHVDGAYALSDQIVGEIRQQLGPKGAVLVVSDHGFRNADGGAHAVVPHIDELKQWLEPHIGAHQIVRVGRKLILTPDAPISDQALPTALAQMQFEDGTAMYRVEPFPQKTMWSLSVENVPPEADWEGIEVGGLPLTDLVSPGRADDGEHDARGIVVMAGPGVAPRDLGTVSQLDLTPTILAYLGLPVGNDMKGSSWIPESTERVESHDPLAPSKRVEAKGPADMERLQQLGYVD